MARSRLGLIVVVLCSGIAVAADAPVPHLSWNPCYRDFGSFECATAHVPLDYETVMGETPDHVEPAYDQMAIEFDVTEEVASQAGGRI